ncbi:MAG: TraR/DksA family transcriptional regulator [Planctomycetota bacterium]|jgi:DnaK suppressor protein
MPARKPQESPPKPKRTKKRRFPKGGPTKADLKRYKAELLRLRVEILRSSKHLADEALKGSGQDFSVDHMADHGTDNFEQDFSLSLLEGESELFRDIQDALEKIEGRGELPYGLCEDCAENDDTNGEVVPVGPWIPKGRLEAVPYARLCVAHQEIEEQLGE